MPKDNRSISEQIGQQLVAKELLENTSDGQYEKLTPSELTPQKDARSENALAMTLKTLRENKPNDRSEKDRRYVVTITELEKVFGYFNTYVISGLEV